MLENTESNVMISRNDGEEEDLDLPLFGLPVITIATNNFSEINKIGEGGFGPVYRVSISFPFLRTLLIYFFSNGDWGEIMLEISKGFY